MGYLSSPRRRRRLLWLGASAAVVAAVLLANALLPSHGGPVRVQRTTSTVSFEGDAAEQAAARRTAAAVEPLARRFVGDLVDRKLDDAYALLAPKTRDHYSLLDWQAGRDLPLHGVGGAYGVSLAFSGARTAGFVATFGETLFAVRFDRLEVLGWRVAYMHQGHSSSYVSAGSYAPAGFAPGSKHETLGTWLVLFGGLLALIAVVALIDWRMSRS